MIHRASAAFREEPLCGPGEWFPGIALTTDPASVTCPACLKSGGGVLSPADVGGGSFQRTPEPGAAAQIGMAGRQLRAALDQLRRDPRACGPSDLPSLLGAAEGVLLPLADVVAQLAGADLDIGRRQQLENAARDLRRSLALLTGLGTAA